MDGYIRLNSSEKLNDILFSPSEESSQLAEFASTQNQTVVGRGSLYERFRVDHQKDEIRLLRMETGNLTDTIRCSFEVVSLNRGPKYHALSYVWGEERHEKFIMVEGAEVVITNNLHSALHRLRAHYHGQDLTIWVDAICIDQGTTIERNHQVALMGKIYSSSEDVLIWLGELNSDLGLESTEDDDDCLTFSGDSSDFDERWGNYLNNFSFYSGQEGELRAIRFRDGISNVSSSIHDFGWTVRLLAELHNREAQINISHITEIPAWQSFTWSSREFSKGIRKTIRRLSENPWFTRMWVIQEVALAPSAYVFCGPMQISLQLLENAAVNLQDHLQRGCCPKVMGTVFDTNHSLQNSLFMHWRSYENDLLNLLSLFKESRNPIRARIAQTNEHVLDLCLRFQTRKVSQEHNRIYSLLSISNQETLVPPDYRLHASELYQKVCAKFISRTKSLLPLCYSGIKWKHPHLPSFIIDFSMFERFPTNYVFWKDVILCYSTPSFFQKLICNDLSTSTAVPRAFSNYPSLVGNSLKAYGIELDIVDFISSTAPIPVFKDRDFTFLSDKIPYTTDRERLRQWKALISTTNTSSVYSGLDSKAYAWINLLSAGCSMGRDGMRQLTPSELPYIHDQLSFSKETSELGYPLGGGQPSYKHRDNETSSQGYDMIREWLSVVQGISAGRRIFSTSRGSLGIGNANVRTGDYVFMLFGSPMPIVLRAVRNVWDEESKDMFNVVSDCYMHGSMPQDVFEKYQRAKEIESHMRLIEII